jgi:ATP-binding cassette subfamily C (CFTR/MRP) protein 4
MHVVMLVLGPICVTVYLNAWISIPLLVLIIIFLYIRKYCLKSSLELKRIEGIVRSPVYVHVNNTLSGLATIRASLRQEKLIQEFYTHIDRHTSSVFLSAYVNRWLGVRLDWIASVFTYISIFSFIMLKDNLNLNSGQVGIMLVYICQLIGLFQWGVRQSVEVENLMTSVERLLEYVSLPNENNNYTKHDKKDKKKKKENKSNKKIYKINEDEEVKIITNKNTNGFIKNDKSDKIKPPKEWPTKGEIVFDNVSFSYDENLPDVLKELSFKINPGEKIGIVGRTGAGKSSIIQTLFRMAEPSGNIFIDNINIQDIDLNELRSKISIIPVMFYLK